MTSLRSVGVGLGLCAVHFAASAQDAVDVDAESFRNAVRVEAVAPEYPREALRQNKAGWVQLSFIVSPDGNVIEPMIEDTSGIEIFEQSALAAIRQWRYEPATVNGEPVEQSMVQVRIVFELQGGAPELRSAFRRQYSRIAELVDSGKLDEAEPLLTDLEFEGRVNLGEDAWFWWLKSAYLEKAEADEDVRLEALRRALGYGAEYLSPDVFVVASQRLYALQLEKMMLRAARATFERLRDATSAQRSDHHKTVIAALTPSYDLINDVATNDQVLVVNATIGDFDYWVHQLFRRSFSLADVQGRIDVVDVRCTRGNKRYESFPIDSVWQVPESWGDCGVYIKGEPGTTFALEELPSVAAPPAQ